jgi:hypothetical protein
MPAIAQPPCSPTSRRARDKAAGGGLRRYSRETGSWPVVLETRDGWLRLPLIDLNAGGAKVRFTEVLGRARKRLYFPRLIGVPERPRQ